MFNHKCFVLDKCIYGNLIVQIKFSLVLSLKYHLSRTSTAGFSYNYALSFVCLEVEQLDLYSPDDIHIMYKQPHEKGINLRVL